MGWRWVWESARRISTTAGFVCGAGGATVLAAAATVGCDGKQRAPVTVGPDDKRFRTLAARSGVMLSPSVALGVGGSGRGLVTTKRIAEDEVLARVPVDLCLTHQKGRSPREDTDWPFWLSCRLLQSVDGGAPASADASANPAYALWPAYASEGFLPSQEETTRSLLCARPTEWLRKFAHWPLVQKLLMHREQTERLFEETTGRSIVPTRFTWAQALVLSRSFGLSEDGDLIGLIPFLDMLNHSETPNTKLHVDARRNQVYAYALTDIAPGEELVISYADGGVPNPALLMKYGFCLEHNSTAVLLLTPVEAGLALSPTRLMAYLQASSPTWEAEMTAQVGAVLQALPVLSGVIGESSHDDERRTASSLLKLLSERLALVERDATAPDLGPLALIVHEELSLLRAAVGFLQGYVKALSHG